MKDKVLILARDPLSDEVVEVHFHSGLAAQAHLPAPLSNPFCLQYLLGILGEGEGGVRSVQVGAWALASLRLAF